MLRHTPPLPRLSPVTLIALAGTMVGCSGDRDAPRGASLAEVDGVPTITIDGLWSDGWPEPPGLVLDTILAPADGDAISLSAPVGVAFLPGGELAVADVQTISLWSRDAGGAWTQTLARGGGPNELRGIGALWMTSDGLVVHDPGRGTAVLVVDGVITNDAYLAIPAPAGMAGAMNSPEAWPLGGGRWLFATSDSPDPSGLPTTIRPDRTFRIVDVAESEPITTIGTGPGTSWRMSMGGGGPVPHAPSAYGTGAFGVVAFGSGIGPDIEVRDADGTILHRIHWTDAPVSIDAEFLRASFVEGARAMVGDELPEETVRQLFDRTYGDVDLPTVLPHFGGLRIAPGGAVWVGDRGRSGIGLPDRPDEIGEWRVVTAPGAASDGSGWVVYRVVLPPRATVIGMDDDGGAFVRLLDDVGRPGIAVLRWTGAAGS